MKAVERVVWICIVILLGGLLVGPRINLRSPDLKPPGPRMVVVVYESAEHPLPLHVHAARPPIEEAGHEFRVVDDDVTTGEGTTPTELTTAIEAARRFGLPSLVIDDKAMALPGTTEEIVAAALR